MVAIPGTRSSRLSAGKRRILPASIDIDEFRRVISDGVSDFRATIADDVVSGVPLYAGDLVRQALRDHDLSATIMDEWSDCLSAGPGVFVVTRAFGDLDVVQRMTHVFGRLMDEERRDGPDAADHFAEAGANSRVWNALQKSALLDPAAFVSYYSNPIIALAAESWLGPWYQLSSQVNVVHPGGQSQAPHRDYHLGFQSDADVARFPIHAHRVSQALTLQGAVAHSNMPIESGPTRLLPFSQLYELGYMAWRHPDFVAYFDEHSIQLDMHTGDAVFFNPGLHHAAGENRTEDIDRVANLLQISSAMGRPMESIDTYTIAAAVYGPLRDLADRGRLSPAEVQAAIAASADGYSFPSNLDSDPPRDGMSPESAQQLMARALRSGWTQTEFADALAAHRGRRRP